MAHYYKFYFLFWIIAGNDDNSIVHRKEYNGEGKER